MDWLYPVRWLRLDLVALPWFGPTGRHWPPRRAYASVVWDKEEAYAVIRQVMSWPVSVWAGMAACSLLVQVAPATAEFSAGLKLLLAPGRSVLEPAGTEVPIVVRGEPGVLAAAIQEVGGRPGVVVGDIASALVPLGSLRDLEAFPGVYYVEAASQPSPANDTAVQQTGAEGLWNGPEALTGEGVIVGIIDSGIEWEHVDFRTPGDPRRSRILSLWDQADDTGPRPDGFHYGTEWTREQIGDALSGSPVRPPGDESGHGTHVAATAAGSGNGNPRYRGVAPGAEIVFVKWGMGSSFLDGAAYIYGIAERLGRPAVVNYSNLSSLVPDLESEALEHLLQGHQGRVFVAAAGNGGSGNVDGRRHWGGGELGLGPQYTTYRSEEVPGEDGQTESALVLLGVLLGDGTADIGLGLGPDELRWRSLDSLAAEGDAIVDSYSAVDGLEATASWAASAREGFLEFSLEVTEGTDIRPSWFVAARGTGVVHLWNPFFGTSADQPEDSDVSDMTYKPLDNRYTVFWPASSPAVIAVGAYANKPSPLEVSTGDLLPSSSRGPSILGDAKPEITAPGVLTSASSTTQDGYQTGAGTSMSAPVVAGAVALYLQRFPTAALETVRADLLQGAREDSHTGVVPNDDWGYGKLDAFAFVHGLPPDTAVRQETPDSTVSIHLSCYPNPFNEATTISYSLPNPDQAELSIYDITGQFVRRLAAGGHAHGSHQVVWDGRDVDGHRVASGVYLYALRAGREAEVQRMVLAK